MSLQWKHWPILRRSTIAAGVSLRVDTGLLIEPAEEPTPEWTVLVQTACGCTASLMIELMVE
jgi:hypothetical protein